MAQQQGQLSNWPRGLEGTQTDLSWRATDACLDGRKPRAVQRPVSAAHSDGTKDSASPRRATSAIKKAAPGGWQVAAPSPA